MTRLILASKSAIRASLLTAAGLELDLVPADIDERAVEAPALALGASPGDVAELLAVAKARAVAALHPGRLVIGADQTLALGTRRFSKPRTRAEARAHLEALAGRTHTLTSGAALVEDGAVLWSGVQGVDLTMRPLSADFLESYLDRLGETVFTTVGGYQLEGLGVQLFQAIEGDYFAVLGLPLLPLLAALRTRGVLEA